jgi:hypothetical protein
MLAVEEEGRAISANQTLMTPAGVITFEYFISTEKLGHSTVVLRIDEARKCESSMSCPR